jgi:transcriptional regulator with GAF, ATPase, and Fis domain
MLTSISRVKIRPLIGLTRDEIGEASPALQANLLRLLQEREARAVGSDRVVQVDVRFVAATNRDLAPEVRRGAFREDLAAAREHRDS